ncbi:MAG: hypothetical protein HY554_15080 [Elusimicrobia bacterium]|nr:hypothetical protein [Elusimicrobiota bacterium]
MDRHIAAALLAALLCTTAARAENGADASLGHAALAVETLRGGLADGASPEAASAAGFQAETLLIGGTAGGAAGGAVDASRGSAGALAARLSAGAEKRTRPDVGLPGTGPQEPPKPRGILGGLRDAARFLLHPAAQTYGSLGRAQRVALLAALVAVEIAVMAYPYHAVGIAMRAIAVLGLVGTTRELIARFRRGG